MNKLLQRADAGAFLMVWPIFLTLLLALGCDGGEVDVDEIPDDQLMVRIDGQMTPERRAAFAVEFADATARFDYAQLDPAEVVQGRNLRKASTDGVYFSRYIIDGREAVKHQHEALQNGRKAGRRCILRVACGCKWTGSPCWENGCGIQSIRSLTLAHCPIFAPLRALRALRHPTKIGVPLRTVVPDDLPRLTTFAQMTRRPQAKAARAQRAAATQLALRCEAAPPIFGGEARARGAREAEPKIG